MSATTIPEREALRARIRKLLDERQVSMAHLAAHTPYSDGALKNFLYRLKASERWLAEIAAVVERAERHEILLGGERAIQIERAPERVRPAPAQIQHGFYLTEPVRRIAEVLDYCAVQCAIGVATAEFGVGKTEAIRHWRREHAARPSVVFEFDQYTDCNKLEFINALAELVDVPRAASNNVAGGAFRAIVERLRAEPALMIFDQCETVKESIFQIVRQIHDRTSAHGVGVALLAAPVLLRRLHGSRAADLGALTSRVGVWAAIDGVSREEMAEIVRQEGIADIEERAFALWWRATGGQMRRLMKSIALLRAKHEGRRVSEATIAGMARHLWGMEVALPRPVAVKSSNAAAGG